MKHLFKIFSLALLLTLAVLPALPALTVQAASVLHVFPTATGTGNCSSWANACTLQTALTNAASGDEIWVMKGTHKPSTDPANRSATFQLKDGVAVYGGFAGTENARTQRDPAVNVTILSGDIDNNDSQTPIITDLATVAGNTTNSYHVVTVATGATVAILDGFTITAGYANGSSPNNRGGGMYYNDSSPTLTNLTFSGNSAGAGGGMYTELSAPTLTSVTFNGNSAIYGGGLASLSSEPTLMNVTFSGNSTTTLGGGLASLSSSPTLTNVTFSYNSATNSGGGMYNEDSSPTLINGTFSGNSARDGGGMYYKTSASTLTNVTFSGNSATNSGGGIYHEASNSNIRNTILWGNTAPTGAQIHSVTNSPIMSYSVVQGGYAGGTSIITADPLLGAFGNNGGFTKTIPLLAGSSAIDTGNDAVCPATDQRGVSRPQGAHCDIGAFELDQQLKIYLPLIMR